MDQDLIVPKVSIIMPAYNAENYIGKSVKSVLDQTFKNWELIIIDDGSSDRTAEICKKYVSLDNRIIYVFQENSKQATARNNGLKIAKGDIIAFLDSDDLWLPTKLELSLSYFDLNKFDLIFTDSYSGSDYEIKIESDLNKMNVIESEYFGKEALAQFIEFNRIPILTVLVKKQIIENINFFDSQCVLAEDYDLWLRLLKAGYRFKSINLPLSIYRVQQNSSTASDRLTVESVLNIIMKNFTYKEISQMNVDHFIKTWIKRWIRIYLDASNAQKLKQMLSYFHQQNKTIIIILLGRRFFTINFLKRLILKFI